MIRPSRNGSRSPTRASASPRPGPCASKLKMPLRYGENPHQQAALYMPVGPHARGIAQAEQVQGKELSYNNLNDANAALELVAEFRDGRADHRHRQARQPVRRRDARHAGRCLGRGAGLRQRLGVRRDRRHQPSARRRHGRSHQPDFHRSGGRARRRRRRQGDLRQEEEFAAAADRRAARPGARRPNRGGHRRRHPGAGPR